MRLEYRIFQPIPLVGVIDAALGRTLYSGDDGQPELRDSIVAFVDELGFGARLENLTSEELREDVIRYDAVRANFFAPSGEVDDKLRVLFFSDNVGVAAPVAVEGSRSTLEHVLRKIAKYQMELTIGGRFSRGGITRGDAYADYSIVTGIALARAVEIEKHARFPRVVLDQSCVDVAVRRADQRLRAERNEFEWRQYLVRDYQDVIVNYLAAMLAPRLADFQIEIVLENHRDHALQRMKAYSENAHLLEKYQWVAEYHDYFVYEVARLPAYAIGAQRDTRFSKF